MTEARQRYQIAQKSAEIVKKNEKNPLFLRYGRASTRDTLDAREDYLDAIIPLFLPLIDANIINHHLLRELSGYTP